MRVFCIGLVAMTGCTSTTLINTRPPGANVYVDGRFIGQAPAQWSETVWAGTRNNVRLSMEGYNDTNAVIAADQWSIGRVVASVLCFLPGLLWSTEYRPSYEFALQPAGGNWYQPPGQMPPGYYPPPPPPGATPSNQPPPLPERSQQPAPPSL